MKSSSQHLSVRINKYSNYNKKVLFHSNINTDYHTITFHKLTNINVNTKKNIVEDQWLSFTGV